MTSVCISIGNMLVGGGRHRIWILHTCHTFTGESRASLYDSVEVVDVVVGCSVKSAETALLVSNIVMVKPVAVAIWAI